MSEIRRGIRIDWLTAASQHEDLDFIELRGDCSSLVVIVESASTDRDAPVFQYCFKWNSFCAYRNTLEEHRLPWDLETHTPSQSGATNIVSDSGWIRELKEKNDLLEILQPNLRHYVIANSTYTTEILSNQEPEISIIPMPK